MSLAELSSLGIVTSAVLYLAAFIAHSGEWALVRGVPVGASSDERQTQQRIKSDTWGRLGVGLTVIAAGAHLLGVVTRGLAAGRAPWGNMYEFVTASLAFVVVAYLLGVWRLGLRWLGIGMTLLLALGNGLAATVLYVAVAPLVPALHSVWFVIHIVAACISAAAFNLGGIASILYLVKKRALGRAGAGAATAGTATEPVTGADDVTAADAASDTPVTGSGAVAVATRRRRAKAAEPALTGFLGRLPTLSSIDTLAYRAIAFGFPVWTFTIAAGSVWAEYAWGRFWGWDPKETWSLVTWVIFAGYLHARATAGWRGRNAAIIAIIGLTTFWFNFIGVNLLINGLHSYAGI